MTDTSGSTGTSGSEGRGVSPGTSGSEGRGVPAAIAEVRDPRLFHSLGQLGMVRSLDARRRSTDVTIAVPRSVYGGESGRDSVGELVARIKEAVADAGAPSADVSLIEMTSEEESELAARIHELGLSGRQPIGAEPGPGHRPGGQTATRDLRLARTPLRTRLPRRGFWRSALEREESGSRA